MKKHILLALVFWVNNIKAEEIYATFTVHAMKEANLAFNYSGIVKEINVDIMSVVKQGDILATLISDDLIASNNASKVILKYAKLDYERYKELLKKKLIDKAQLDKYALAYESIKAQIRLEETIHAKTILRAPFDGVITRRMIESGDVVSGQMIKTAYNIQSEHERILFVECDQKYSNDVKIGDAFIYNIEGSDRQYQGTVFRIFPTTNTNNRKIAIQVIAMDLKVGLFGEGKIITSDRENKTTVKATQE